MLFMATMARLYAKIIIAAYSCPLHQWALRLFQYDHKSYTIIVLFSARLPDPLITKIGYYTNIYRWILLEYEISLKYKEGFL